MKILLALFLIIFEIIIKSEGTQDFGQIYKYSKKVRIPVQRGIKIINSRKFDKLRALHKEKANIRKQGTGDNTYTVFPPIPIAERRSVDAPHGVFVQEPQVDSRKSRVKKVLPEYSLTVFRNKRSINNVSSATSYNIKKKYRKRSRNDTTTIKSIGKNSSRKSRKNTKSKRKTKRNITEHIVIKKIKTKKSNKTQSKHKQAIARSRANLKYTGNPEKKISPRFRDIVKKKVTNKKSNRDRRVEEKKVRNRRLIAARDASIEQYPYVASIQKDGQHWCAGALLNPRLVITTANCVWKSRSVSRMTVRAGSRYMIRGGQVAKIQEVVKHPGWSVRSLPDNDVALLFLDRNIKFSDSVHGVDLPNHAMYPVFEDAWVTSWGSERTFAHIPAKFRDIAYLVVEINDAHFVIRAKKKYSELELGIEATVVSASIMRDGIFSKVGVTLQVYHARLLDHAKCNNITQRFGVSVSHNFICLAQTGRRAPCTRDTGAPAVSDGILWGLASWGIRRLCGTERFPAMFSYLASKSNLDFITNATHYLMSDKRMYPYPDRFIINSDITETILTTNIEY